MLLFNIFIKIVILHVIIGTVRLHYTHILYNESFILWSAQTWLEIESEVLKMMIDVCVDANHLISSMFVKAFGILVLQSNDSQLTLRELLVRFL